MVWRVYVYDYSGETAEFAVVGGFEEADGFKELRRGY
jgi:hypothetical protein